MTKSRSKLLLALTIVLALATMLLVAKYLNNVKEAAVQGELSTIVVPVEKITMGTKITDKMLTTKEMPTKYLPLGTVTSKEAVLNKYAATDLWKDGIIISDQIVPEKSRVANELPYKIPEGKRAITIPVNSITGVAGHIKPGHYVDILLSYKESDKPEDQKAVTLLQKIEVLAVGVDLEKKPGAQVVENITLAVTPQDAQVITLTETIGKMRLVLRPEPDSGNSTLKSFDLKHFYNMY